MTFLTMLLFALLIIASGHTIELIRPQLEFGNYNPNEIIFKAFGKLFLSSIGIISIQLAGFTIEKIYIPWLNNGLILTVILERYQ
ncbi:MAG: hypothetical protein EOO47_12150 [Flavobacterium sp.]|nr:MAG: hypothetical protein EOO47_12150 [Flavobacterium sp.]